MTINLWWLKSLCIIKKMGENGSFLYLVSTVIYISVPIWFHRYQIVPVSNVNRKCIHKILTKKIVTNKFQRKNWNNLVPMEPNWYWNIYNRIHTLNFIILVRLHIFHLFWQWWTERRLQDYVAISYMCVHSFLYPTPSKKIKPAHPTSQHTNNILLLSYSWD